MTDKDSLNFYFETSAEVNELIFISVFLAKDWKNKNWQ